MKASKVIERLTELMAVHGDREVYIKGSEWADPIEEVDLADGTGDPTAPLGMYQVW